MNQALYLESISILTKEFLNSTSFDNFLQASKNAFTQLITTHAIDTSPESSTLDSTSHHNTTAQSPAHFHSSTQSIEKDTIRKAIIDFLAQRGMKAIVLFSPKGIEIKTSILHREKNAYVDFLVRYLDEKHYIEPLKNNDCRCLGDIFASLQETHITDPSLIKDIVRGALKKVLGLKERDSVFFNNVEPLIRNFDIELVQNNAQIRELLKSHHKQSILDESTKSYIRDSLKNIDLTLLSKHIIQEILREKFHTMQPLEFLSAFSFSYIQALCKKLESSLEASVRIRNAYCVESYHTHKDQIFEELAQEILHLLDMKDRNARACITLFSGKVRTLNGREFYIPVIQDSDSKVWGLDDITYILHSERDINNTIKTHKDTINNASQRLEAIEQEMRSNNERAREKNEAIQVLSQEYEQKKSQSSAYEKADIETRNAMTKVINSLLQQKIQALDSIAQLKSRNTALQEERHTLQNAQKSAQADINLITRENKESLYRFHNLLRAFSLCMCAIVRDLDDYK